MASTLLVLKKLGLLTRGIMGRSIHAVCSMNGGDGPLSYVKNSSYQRGVLDVAKPMIEEEIAAKLDINPNTTLCIADFGCSTGHNSFPAMNIVIQAIKQKYQSSLVPEFHVFFNDVVDNDYTTLFSSLPAPRNYHAAVVPGDFHRRLLPASSLHFAHSSWSLQWLTKVPAAVVDRNSSAWNAGEILYTAERKEVCDAYLDQFADDMQSFLKSRAVEMVGGGLMTLLVPGVPIFWNPRTEYTIPQDINILGSCLVDMARKGRLSEEKINSFNLPYYFATSQELKAILERNQSFTIERMEILENPGKYTLCSIQARVAFYRAVHERLLTNHFGSEIIDELFDLYVNKLEASPVPRTPNNDKSIVVLAILKRKLN